MWLPRSTDLQTELQVKLSNGVSPPWRSFSRAAALLSWWPPCAAASASPRSSLRAVSRQPTPLKVSLTTRSFIYFSRLFLRFLRPGGHWNQCTCCVNQVGLALSRPHTKKIPRKMINIGHVGQQQRQCWQSRVEFGLYGLQHYGTPSFCSSCCCLGSSTTTSWRSISTSSTWVS